MSHCYRQDPGDNIDSQSRHVHLGVCFPFAKLGSVTGQVVFDVLFQLHNVPVMYNAVSKSVTAPAPLVVDANLNGVIPPYMGATGFTYVVCN